MSVPRFTLLCIALGMLASGLLAQVQAETVAFDSDRWVIKRGERATFLGRSCLRGIASLEDVEFENGVIAVDIAVDGSRSYPGIEFHRRGSGNTERIYLRPHRAALYPDALQYTPVFNGVAGWQLYNGTGFTAGARIPANEWVRLRVEIAGSQARVFWGDGNEPALLIPELKHGAASGALGVVGPTDGAAYFSNFSYEKRDDLMFDLPAAPAPLSGMITDWELSEVIPPPQVDLTSYPSFFATFGTKWEPVTSDASGLVNVSRYRARSGAGSDCVWARKILVTERKRDVQLSTGYSDTVSVFLNGRRVFSGRSGYQSRDPSFLGAIGLHDTIDVTLERGRNEIFLMVAEEFGGWGFMCRPNLKLREPVPRHELTRKVWETEEVFLIPESVVYDPERNVLYVSSFNRLGTGGADGGFISKLGLDGEVLERDWVTGLDGPCGMVIADDKLYVTEGFRRNLVVLALDTGSILARYPCPSARFLNDVTVDTSGNIYVSNSTPVRHADDIYRLEEGELRLWQRTEELWRANGLFVSDDSLLVGNSGDGKLKAVGLDHGCVSDIVCLGAGIVDGIRLDGRGNYLVSQWEGRLYRVSPEGEPVEVLNTAAEGCNIADFEYIQATNLLVIPTFLGNKVVAYELGSD